MTLVFHFRIQDVGPSTRRLSIQRQVLSPSGGRSPWRRSSAHFGEPHIHTLGSPAKGFVIVCGLVIPSLINSRDSHTSTFTQTEAPRTPIAQPCSRDLLPMQKQQVTKAGGCPEPRLPLACHLAGYCQTPAGGIPLIHPNRPWFMCIIVCRLLYLLFP